MKKLTFLYLFVSLLFLAVLVKLFFIQILASESYSANYLKTQKILPDRGNIFDRRGEPLVLNQTTYKLFVEPKKIEDVWALIKRIDDVLKIGEATLSEKLNTDKLWIPIAGNITKEKKDALAKLDLPGVGFETENKRYYSEGSIAAHLLGFVGKNNDGDNLGYFGVEGYYEKDLAGLPGILKTERDILGNPIFIGIQDKLEGENGRDLTLTVDKTVQLIAKNKLKDGIERYGAKSGCVIVADPKTMQILAMTCLPDYDPNKYFEFSEDYFGNPAIAGLYEPGSIFKPLVVAAALNERAIKPDQIYDETGPIKIGEYQIRTWDNQYKGKVTITQILEKSSNVGMVYIGEKLGQDKLVEYMKKFGLGELTGIDLQGEAAGNLKPPDQWYPIDYATATFGQGISLTPIQMLRAFAAIINGGYLLQPYTVFKTGSDGKPAENAVFESRRVIDERSSLLIKKMLQDTVEHGEVRWAKPEGYAIGGKTGTAQIPIEGHYDPSKTIASFVGFGPVEDPKFIVLVTLREPTSSPWGSETAAPLFFEVAKDLLVYYNIPPQ